jgi:hypothetical protein
MMQLIWKFLESWGEARAATFLTRQGRFKEAIEVYNK